MSAPGFDDTIRAAASDAQKRAAHHGVSVFVEANAGSGKTRVLVDRVVNILLQGVAPEGRFLQHPIHPGDVVITGTPHGARAQATGCSEVLVCCAGDEPQARASTRPVRLQLDHASAPFC